MTGKCTRPNSDNDVPGLQPKSLKNNWDRPELRKLAIAATAGSKTNSGNEGMGQPKSGDAGPLVS